MRKKHKKILYLIHDDNGAVVNSVKYEWNLLPLRARHQRLWLKVFRRLFRYCGLSSKHLISFFWNIDWRLIADAPAVVASEWLIQHQDFFVFVRRCFPRQRLIIYSLNIRESRNYERLRESGWEVWSFDRGESEKYGLGYNKPFMAAQYVPFEHPQSPAASGGHVIFFGRDKGRKDKIMEIKHLLDSENIANDIRICDSRDYICSYSELLAQTQHCKAILDVPLERQEGTTQREMEALFFRKKLITTSTAVKRRDYYHPDNIFVLDLTRHSGESRNLTTIAEFLQKPCVEIDKKIIDSYSIEAWLQRFIEKRITYTLPKYKNIFPVIWNYIVLKRLNPIYKSRIGKFLPDRLYTQIQFYQLVGYKGRKFTLINFGALEANRNCLR
jgi:hypothetical protein